MTTAHDIFKRIKDNDIRFIDLRFTDSTGKLHHMTMDARTTGEKDFTNGFVFDASAIDGWKAVNEADMVLLPDPETAHIDPFLAQPTLIILCDILDPATQKPYSRDPRNIAKKAEAYFQSLGIGDSVNIGSEADFFIFDDVRYKVDPFHSSVQLNSNELTANDNTEYEMGNLGHRPRVQGGYFSTPPVDAYQDMRSEMLTALSDMGISVTKHYHQAASAQHKLGMHYDTLVRQADKMQIYKYGIQQVANSYGKTATFMPKPIFNDNGSSMHVHLSIWQDGKTIFAGNEYADVSESCLFFIGGILHHARALNALTNPSTNSYKRLVPGYDAPFLLAYSAGNRSASCRIPLSSTTNGKHIEVRFPDPTANPYLAFAALLMAGLDGINNKIHPGQAIDKNLYDLSLHDIQKIPSLCGSLREALQALDNDRAFLTAGDVFTNEQIDSFITLKMKDVMRFETTPHPIEFDMYYSV